MRAGSRFTALDGSPSGNQHLAPVALTRSLEAVRHPHLASYTCCPSKSHATLPPSTDVLSAFIYLLTKNNETVGYLQGVNGICQVRELGSALRSTIAQGSAALQPARLASASRTPACLRFGGPLQMLAALPAGVLTDRWRRDTMLRVAAAVGLVAGLFLGKAGSGLLWWLRAGHDEAGWQHQHSAI